MRIIGLSGGIATGKSTISAYLLRHGIAVVDADVIARSFWSPTHPVYAALLQLFLAHDPVRPSPILPRR